MPAVAKDEAKKDKKATLQTAEAGTGKKKREKKEKVKRVAWGERGEKGELKTKIKGTSVEGFDSKVHLPLRRGDFENPADFYTLTADRLEAKAKALRAKAVEEASLGSVADRKKAKRLKSHFEKFNEMMSELKAAGMSDDAIKAILNAGGAAPAAEAAPAAAK